jgi:large subunit ribosomal protein L28
MARRCEFTGKGVQAGNNVSHANNRTRRRFLPNMQVVSFLSEALGEHIQVRLSVYAIRSIEKRGGLDAYLLSTSTEKLGKTARVLKRRIRKATEKRAVASSAEAPAA